MINSQSRMLAVAALTVAAVLGGVTLLDRNQGSNASSAAATSPSSVVASALPATTAAATTVPTTIPTTTPTTIAAAAIPVATIPAATNPPPPDAGCAAAGPSAVLDRDQQSAWLCNNGYITTKFAISTAWSMPDPGVYQVYAKDRTSTSTFGGHLTTLKNFVAFSFGENTGARVAFHSIPILPDGSLLQPIDSVGDLTRRGESSGCIRVVPDISQLIWDTLSIGDTVTVLN